MSENLRFDIWLSPERKRDLDAMAKELGVSARDLARIGIGWVLAKRDVLLRGVDAPVKRAA